MLKMDLKELHFADVAEIQEAVTDELKKISKNVRQRNSLYIGQFGLFWIKNVCVLHECSIFKMVSPNNFETHCLCISRAEASEIYGSRRINFQAEN